MLRRTFLSSLPGAAWLLAQGRAARKPNFILLFADDLGYGDIGCYGSPDVPTPNIDALAKNGVRCTDGYVSCAVCSPSRAAMLTGRYQHRFGHEFNSGPPEREAEVGFGLPAGEKIAPVHLKAAGYRSGMFGKWHLGVRPGYHPMDRGFDEFFGFLTGANAYAIAKTPGKREVESGEGTSRIPESRPQPIYRGREPVEESRYLTDALGDEAVSFIERNQKQPFFLYVPFNAVHTPLHATAKYWDRFPGIANARHRALAAMTSAMDDAVGRIVAKVRQLQLERDTLIVFLSDNGCPVITGAGTNGPLNGQKVTYYEGGIRVPFILHWPGMLPAGETYSKPVVSRDLLPTFLTAAGLKPAGMDGVDLVPYLTGKRASAPHEALYWRGGKARAVRMGKWKLIEFGENYSKLYDLSADLGEKNDLSSKHPEVVKELRQSWKMWSDGMMTPRWPPRYRELTVNGEKLNWEL